MAFKPAFIIIYWSELDLSDFTVSSTGISRPYIFDSFNLALAYAKRELAAVENYRIVEISAQAAYLYKEK